MRGQLWLNMIYSFQIMFSFLRSSDSKLLRPTYKHLIVFASVTELWKLLSYCGKGGRFLIEFDLYGKVR